MLRFAIAEDDRNKVVSALAQIEARSAICRLRKANRMTSDEASIALDSIAAEVRRMIEQPINPPVLEAASTLVERHYLRALDAVQLGCAIVARDLLAAPEMRMVASDSDLLKAAKKEGFETWNLCD
ncbi:MAG: type II toxin-antitoxin system VapC family toxin [Acidobacteriota bacterium]|nr:type II toxin-antitoxin system VapC family toxin [Acidobacteriota bacterium]